MNFSQVNTIQPGDYYRLRHDVKGWSQDSITDDRMYLVIEHRHDTVRFMGIFPNAESIHSAEKSWTCSDDEFYRDFEFCQEASDKRQKLLESIVADLHEPTSMKEVNDALHAIQNNPKALLEDFQATQKEEANPNTSVAMTVQERTALAQRDQIARVRSLVQRKSEQFAKRQRHMELAMREKTALLKARMNGLESIVKSMQYMVNAMNVYLGIGEGFGVIREGKRAPASEMLVVRQLVLYADEECALEADHGGIDINDFNTFIEWMVAKPERIEQVIPETKGIVAMQMRRDDKDYCEDPLVNAKMNLENKKTWFIIRNGEALYYVWPEFNVRERLFPTAHELDKIFIEERLYDKWERPIRPGESKWIEAVDKADHKKKQMMVGLLFLQGLVDRTDVLAPFPDEAKPNLADPADHDKYVIYRRDAEMVLHDGRPSWREYLHRINLRLHVGCRVVGHWPYNGKDDDYPRCTPSYHKPNDDECYTIHRSDKDGHYFKFEVQYYPQNSSKKSTRSISWQIKDYDDDCFINVDETTEQDLMYYMTDRINRRSYMRMFPVFQRALAFLRREREEEKPFRMLVAGEIAKKHGTQVSWDGPLVNNLLDWWKFKNKFRRAIKEDDAKAIRMIVQCFGQFCDRVASMDDINASKDKLVEKIRSQYPMTLFVGADTGGRLTAFVACYEDREVWYRQHFFNCAGEEDQEPRLMANPWHDVSYPAIYRSKRWNAWGKWDCGNHTLHDDDQRILVGWALETLPGVADQNRHCYSGHSKPKDGQRHPGACFRLLAAVQRGATITFWFQDHAYCPSAGNREDASPTISCAEAKWERKGRQNTLVIVPLESYSGPYNYSRCNVAPGNEPWRGNDNFKKGGRPFWIDKDAENQWYEDYSRWKSAHGSTSKAYHNMTMDIIHEHYVDIRQTWMKKYKASLLGKYVERAMGDMEQCEAWAQKELDHVGYASSRVAGLPMGPHLDRVLETITSIAYKGINEDDCKNNEKDVHDKIMANLQELRTAKTLREIFTMNGVEVGSDWKGPGRKDIDNIPFLDEPIAWSQYPILEETQS